MTIKDWSNETIRFLSDHLDQLEAIKDKYPSLFSGLVEDLESSLSLSAGNVKLAEQGFLQQAIDDTLNNTDFSLPEGTEKEQILNIEKQVQSTIQAIKDAYGKDAVPFRKYGI